MNIRAQVWIETVLYTLIGLALIGLALGFIMPKINEARDRLLVEQAINSLSVLDEKVHTVIDTGMGNARTAEFSMKKGELYFNVANDEIVFVLAGLTKPYSQPGIEIQSGRIYILSSTEQKTSSVSLKVNYTANIVFGWKDEDKKFDASATPYNFLIENNGTQDAREMINIKEISK